MASPAKVDAPVICVGNLTVGGAGKTPMVSALVRRLIESGAQPAVVSRGYGGSVRGPYRVDPAKDTYEGVGDEPLMLAAITPVWVAKDRVAGARAAIADGADIILLDDGFQNPHLVKDASILMVDAGQGFGNGRVVPAGPLREQVASGLARADLAVLVGPPADRDRVLQTWPELASTSPGLGRLEVVETGLSLTDGPILAFAGIGRPEKFFTTLRDLGAELTGTHAFPDHYPYPERIIRRLITEAAGQNAMLVTTEKDATRLPPDLRREVMTVQVTLELEDWSGIDALLARLCQNLS
jgi:tetraacyldisaccharide 4'-kinase